nr:uncharacterized protein LOC105496723 [Macaca nemestrina]
MCGSEHLLCCPKDLVMFPRQLSHTAYLPGTPVSRKCHHIWLQAGVSAWHPWASRCGRAQPASWLCRKAARAFWLLLPAGEHCQGTVLGRQAVLPRGKGWRQPSAFSVYPGCLLVTRLTGKLGGCTAIGLLRPASLRACHCCLSLICRVAVPHWRLVIVVNCGAVLHWRLVIVVNYSAVPHWRLVIVVNYGAVPHWHLVIVVNCGAVPHWRLVIVVNCGAVLHWRLVIVNCGAVPHWRLVIVVNCGAVLHWRLVIVVNYGAVPHWRFVIVGLPKCWDYRCEPPRPAGRWDFNGPEAPHTARCQPTQQPCSPAHTQKPPEASRLSPHCPAVGLAPPHCRAWMCLLSSRSLTDGADEAGTKLFRCRLTQLDVDSHLAQCLAESTEDVMW